MKGIMHASGNSSHDWPPSWFHLFHLQLVFSDSHTQRGTYYASEQADTLVSRYRN